MSPKRWKYQKFETSLSPSLSYLLPHEVCLVLGGHRIMSKLSWWRLVIIIVEKLFYDGYFVSRYCNMPAPRTIGEWAVVSDIRTIFFYRKLIKLNYQSSKVSIFTGKCQSVRNCIIFYVRRQQQGKFPSPPKTQNTGF